MAAEAPATGSSHGVPCAAHGGHVGVGSLPAPQVTRASNRLPVRFDVRVPKPGRRAVASIASDAKKSVTMETARRVQVGLGVSLGWYQDAKGHPPYHLGETASAYGNSIGSRFRRMPGRGPLAKLRARSAPEAAASAPARPPGAAARQRAWGSAPPGRARPASPPPRPAGARTTAGGGLCRRALGPATACPARAPRSATVPRAPGLWPAPSRPCCGAPRGPPADAPAGGAAP